MLSSTVRLFTHPILNHDFNHLHDFNQFTIRTGTGVKDIDKASLLIFRQLSRYLSIEVGLIYNFQVKVIENGDYQTISYDAQFTQNKKLKVREN